MKRLLACLLTAVLLLGMLPAVSAVETRYVYDDCIIYTKNYGEITIVDYLDSIPEEITIPAEIDGLPVLTIGDFAFENCTKLRTVHLPEGLREIKERAFRNSGLTDFLEIPSTVQTIRDSALMNTPLTGIRFLGKPVSIGYDKDLRIIIMPQYWFETKGYSMMKAGYDRIFLSDEEAVPDILTGHQATVDGFRYLVCDQYAYLLRGEDRASVIIPDTVEEKPVRWIMDNAFEQCHSVQSLSLPQSVERIRRCAFQATDLRSLELPSACTRLDTNAFYGVGNLKSADLSHLTWIGDSAFAYTGLESVVLGEGLTELGDMAFLETNLKTVSVPGSVPRLSATFYGCSNLETVTLHEGLRAIDNAFGECSALTNLELPSTVTEIHWLAYETGITSITLPSAVRSLGQQAIMGGDSLKTLILNEGLEEIDQEAFLDTTGLAELRLPASVQTVRDVPDIKNLTVYFHTGTRFILDNYTQPSIRYINVDTGEEVDVNLRVKENGLTYMIRMDHAELIKAKSNEDILVIPDQVCGYPVTIIEKGAISGLPCNRVVLPETVKLIRPGAITGCVNIYALTLPASLEAVEDENGVSNPVLFVPFEGYPTYIVKEGSFAESYAVAQSELSSESMSARVLRYTEENPYLSYGNHVFRVEDGEAALLFSVRRDDTNGVDRVPSSVDGIPVTAVLDGAYEYSGGGIPYCIYHMVVFQPPLRSIGGHLFPDNTSSMDIYLPDTVTEIGENAFTDYTDRLHGNPGGLAESYAASHGDEFVLIDLPFQDVKKSKWYYKAIRYCYQAGYMAGITEDLFDPNGTVSRAMLIQVLYSIAGGKMTISMPEEYECPFTDVKKNKWYYEAIRWAAYYHIVGGTSATTFSPLDPTTREQVAAILYQFARGANMDHGERADLNVFSDQMTISGYARDALSWAVGVGMLSGLPNGTICPKGTCSRAELATMIMHFAELLHANNDEN